MDYCRESRLLRTALVTLCLLTCVGLANAEPVTVSGTVTSAADGEPLIGVTVQVKGTSVGTTTDFDGNYVIKTEMGATISMK